LLKYKGRGCLTQGRWAGVRKDDRIKGTRSKKTYWGGTRAFKMMGKCLGEKEGSKVQLGKKKGGTRVARWGRVLGRGGRDTPGL